MPSHPVIVFLVVAIEMFSALLIQADDSLVAHYTFEEGPAQIVRDWSGQDNHGKIVDDVQFVKLDGRAGYVLQFNNGKALVDCGNAPSLDLTKALTLALWFQPQSRVDQGEGGIIGKMMGSYCLSYSGKVWFYAPGSSNYASSKPLDDGWVHLAATYDSKSIRLYLNGKLQDSVPSKVAQLPLGKNFYLRFPNTYLTVTPDYKCRMDNVRVYNRPLSADEIYGIYQQEAKANGLHNVSLLDQPQIKPHHFAQSSTVVVEVDFGRMAAQAAGTILEIQLRNATGKVVAHHKTSAASLHADKESPAAAVRLEFQDHVRQGVRYWTQHLQQFPPGAYSIRATLKTGNGQIIGKPSIAAIELPLAKPDWLSRYEQTKEMNNLVAELLNISGSQTKSTNHYAFTNPRNGWVFISSIASIQGNDRVFITLDHDSKPAISHQKGQAGPREAMRYLPIGKHTLRVHGDGQTRPTKIVVRSIPEMMVAGLGYNCGSNWTNVPILPCFGRYNMEYLREAGILANTNMLVERNPTGENEASVKAWRAEGKRLFVRYGMSPLWQQTLDTDIVFKAWTESRGLNRDGYDGIIVDEFSGVGHGGVGNYVFYTAASQRIAEDPRFSDKAIYPYCMPMYAGNTAMEFLKSIIHSGFKWAEEKYMVEQPTLAKAKAYMNLRLRENILNYEPTFPGAARHMITTLGFMSAPPETLNVSPHVNFKVYMDMQMNLLANDPVFFGLYGIQWYHNGYVDEEDLRWAARLFRHYGIEGHRHRLTADPYILSHIINPDFEQGKLAWTLDPAEKHSIRVDHATGYGIHQTRIQRGKQNLGDDFLVTQRVAHEPNRFSQVIKHLTPGRTYSLKMFTADYEELQEGKSTQSPHQINIHIADVDLLPEHGFHQLFPSSLAGHVYGPFTRDNPLYITYHRVVFRPQHSEAQLTFSDWKHDTDPGGPIGRQLMYNFIEVQPYFDGSISNPGAEDH